MTVTPVVADPAVILDAVDRACGTRAGLCAELDIDVYRLRTGRPGPDWVVRAVDDRVGRAPLETAAEVLAGLAPTAFPAERCPVPEPVLTVTGHDRTCHLLVTEYVEPGPASRPGFLLAWCAGLLARLATKAGTRLPPGGGWHRLGPTPDAEITAALELAGGLGPEAGALADLLAGADDGYGLPEALIHADLTPPNAIPQGEDRPVIIDWIGTGRGPRLWPLAFLLFAAGPAAAKVVLDRYTRTVTLTAEEWRRLPGVMLARPLTLDLWSVAGERMTPAQAVTRAGQHRARIRATLAAARSAGYGEGG